MGKEGGRKREGRQDGEKRGRREQEYFLLHKSPAFLLSSPSLPPPFPRLSLSTCSMPLCVPQLE